MSQQRAHPSSTPVPSPIYWFCKRLLDFGVALMLLIVLAPAFVLLLPWLTPAGKTDWLVGCDGHPLRLRSFGLPSWLTKASARSSLVLAHLPRLLALLDGRLTLVGPRPLTSAEVELFGGLEHPRFRMAPGMVCLWWLRQRSNIDYGSESDADLEYLSERTLRRDVAMLVRSLIAIAYGPSPNRCEAGHMISGIRLLNLSMSSLLDAIASALECKARTRIAFVNPDCVNIAARDPQYRRTLDGFDWICADGIGMKIAGNLLGQPIRQNLNGTDLFPRLCAVLSASGHSLYLLGARPGIAKAAAQWARARYPELKIVGARSGYFSSTEEDSVLQIIHASGAQVLLVAMGAPRQEIWLERNLEASGATVGIGVGGLFDFYSGLTPRAPLWLREIGGEWIFRLIQEPGRMWRRYLVGNWIFLFRIIVERLSSATIMRSFK